MKKRIMALLVALVMVIGLLPMTARAETLPNRLEYEIYEDSVWITGYHGDATTVVIPAEIKGLPVQVIGSFAFSNCENLTTLDIPSSVIHIDDNAFYMCKSLTNVVLPDSVTYIGDSAFEHCACLTSIDIPDSISYLGPYAFYGCKSLSSIDIPDGITFIDPSTFGKCESLTAIDIPFGILYISNGAFSGCKSLTNINISASVNFIAEDAFNKCPSLTEIHVDANNQNYSSDNRGVLFDKEKTQLFLAPGAISGSYQIPSSVTFISARAFYERNNLTSISIPSSVTYIDNNAFSHCSNLTSIYFAGNAPEIEWWSSTPFNYVTATAYYPAGDPTWTSDVMQAYGGNITWVPYNPNNPFTDVPVGAFYEAPVLWALENGITTGATADTFNPNGQCLRAQVVTFLHRAAGNPAPGNANNPFTDVKTSDFFYAPVLWAVEKGITNGTGAATFGSYDVCNRAAVVTFLWRAAGSPEPKTTDNPFTDVRSSDFFYKPVLWAIENGITNGVDATHFGPTSPCNRAQVVTFLYRAYN